ncbi:MAG: glutathione peroxidase [Ferruginibacter sp.]
MTFKQNLLRLLYPVFNKLTKAVGKGGKVLTSHKMATTSFYDLKATLNNGNELDFSTLKNKKVLIVNTASECGYTAQYEGLQALQEKFENELLVLGFPANDFGAQEKGTDEAIEQFCKVNFGVRFPLVKKSTVIRGPQQHPVYQWLTQEEKNGWNVFVPNWNFCKFLIDEKGDLTHVFESGIEPMGAELQAAVEDEG